MTKIVGVRFRSSGKVYYFNPGDFETRPGSHVIVETVRGVEYGTVVGDPREVDDSQISQPLRSVVRVASEEDEKRAAGNREREREAIALCKEKIRARGLEMKLIDAEYTFDNNKILFYFTADGRVDFRELVKDLASVFRTRIELRQIGVRDETKILGGIGICGRPLCCHTYLTDFVPVSIKMAKEQNLSLNPTKISGVCGRLMCCLKNEEETYEYLNSQLPSNGDIVTTPTGAVGTVISTNVLRQRVKVVIEENDEKEIFEYDMQELKFRSKKGKEHHRKDKDKDRRDKDKDWKNKEKDPAEETEKKQYTAESFVFDPDDPEELFAEPEKENAGTGGKAPKGGKAGKAAPGKESRKDAAAGTEENSDAPADGSEEAPKPKKKHRHRRNKNSRKGQQDGGQNGQEGGQDPAASDHPGS